jgi:hypothetical protein
VPHHSVNHESTAPPGETAPTERTAETVQGPLGRALRVKHHPEVRLERSLRQRPFLFAALAAALTIPCAFAVNNRGLWTDEAISAFFADHARLGHLDEFNGLITGIFNMPVYHLLLAAWASVWGDSEIGLRSFNLPFALLFIASILILCWRSQNRYRYLVAGLFSIFPLLIYYVNDARPYVALLGLSAACTVSFLTFIEEPSKGAARLCIVFGLLAIGMHLFGGLCMLSLLVFICLRTDARRKVITTWRLWMAPFLFATVLSALSLIVYVKGKGIASKASLALVNPDTPLNLASNWKNLTFVSYEWLGFSGLGPPRNDMRIHPNLHTFLPYTGWIVVGLVACALLGLLLLQDAQSQEIKNARTLLSASGISLLIFFFAARVMHFGFYGRHVMSLIGVGCCGIALLLLAPAIKLSRVALVALLLAWAISSVRLVKTYGYGNDDLRTAILVAKNTHLPILWNANLDDPDPAYYNAGDPRESPRVWFVPPPLRSRGHWSLATPFHRLRLGSQQQVDDQAARLMPGRFVLVKGKPDLADPAGLWAVKFAKWNPRLLNRLNGYDVLVVDIPRGDRSKESRSSAQSR